MKILRSFVFAFNGIRYCFKNEINFRIHSFAMIIVLASGIAFHIAASEWLAILLSIALVICLEIINTVAERICDIIHPGPDPKIKVIKDMSAAGVLIAAMISLVIGGIIFLPKIFI